LGGRGDFYEADERDRPRQRRKLHLRKVTIRWGHEKKIWAIRGEKRGNKALCILKKLGGEVERNILGKMDFGKKGE